MGKWREWYMEYFPTLHSQHRPCFCTRNMMKLSEHLGRGILNECYVKRKWPNKFGTCAQGSNVSNLAVSPSLQLNLGLRLWAAILHSPGFWFVDMMLRNPALVIGLWASGHSWPISAQYRYLITRIDVFQSARGFLGSFASFSTPPLLREESTDPGTIDEVTGTSKYYQENEI